MNSNTKNVLLPLDKENSEQYIKRILKERGRIKDKNNYQEQHHIIPKSCNGTDDKDNLIFLYPQEHYEVHRLLALENPNIKPLQSAWWLMCHINGENNTIYVSADDYSEAKSRFAQIQRERMSGENNPGYGKHRSEETKKKIGLANSGEKSGNYGRKRTEEEKQKQSTTFKSNYVKTNHPQYGKHPSIATRVKLSEAGKGRTKTEEHKKKIGLAHIGTNNGNEGAKHGRARKVKCIETQKVFGCLKDAGLWAGLHGQDPGASIGSCANGKRKTAGKHPKTGESLHWEFV